MLRLPAAVAVTRHAAQRLVAAAAAAAAAGAAMKVAVAAAAVTLGVFVADAQDADVTPVAVASVFVGPEDPFGAPDGDWEGVLG